MNDRISVDDRLKCDSPLDNFIRHKGVNTLDDILKWVEMERHTMLEMIDRHETGVHVLHVDLVDFVYGKSAILWEVHVNLLHVMRGLQSE